MNEDNKGGNEPQVGWQYRQDGDNAQVQPQNAQPVPPIQDTFVGSSSQPTPPQPAGAAAPMQQPLPEPNAEQEVTWRAAEFIVHEKSASWYAAFFLIAILVTAVVFFISRDIFSVVTVVAVFILLGWMSVRRPRDVGYQIVSKGLVVNDHLHPYETFKSFGVQDEGGVSSLVFMPLKRFMLPLYAYYPPEDEDKILEALSRHLPFAPTEQSVLERAAHRLKF